MLNSADLRRHAEHCRYLADITSSLVLRQSADDFDAEAKRVDGKRRAAAEPRNAQF
jgi:hypothetical protein